MESSKKKGIRKEDHVPVLSSIKTKIVFAVIFSIVASVLIVLAVSIPIAKENVLNLTYSYMSSMALVSGENLERDISATDYASATEYSKLKKAFKDISVSDLSSSYAYVVSPDGTVLYHPDQTKAGKKIENEDIIQLGKDIQSGKKPESYTIRYDLDGVKKCASFYISGNRNFIVFISANELEIFADIQDMQRKSLIGALAVAIVFGTSGYIVANKIVKPIKGTAKEMIRYAGLDFTKRNEKKYRNDETGIMQKSLLVLRNAVADVVGQVNEQSEILKGAAIDMENSANETKSAAEQVETAINDVAQGATSQAQETQKATENVISMGDMIKETNMEAEQLKKNAMDMNKAGNNAIEILNRLKEVNSHTKKAIDDIYCQTNITNEAAKKIKAATDVITQIAEETNLLSLNASIEAARAGEAGRGFTVVASQIQKLAEQSNESAQIISDIIENLNEESGKTVEIMEKTREVIVEQDRHVEQTEDAFNHVKEGIFKSDESIDRIVKKTKMLDEVRIQVVDLVQNLTAIAEENAASTEETSASTQEVSAIMENMAENAKSLNDIANNLADSIERFKLTEDNGPECPEETELTEDKESEYPEETEV